MLSFALQRVLGFALRGDAELCFAAVLCSFVLRCLALDVCCGSSCIMEALPCRFAGALPLQACCEALP